MYNNLFNNFQNFVHVRHLDIEQTEVLTKQEMAVSLLIAPKMVEMARNSEITSKTDVPCHIYSDNQKNGHACKCRVKNIWDKKFSPSQAKVAPY